MRIFKIVLPVAIVALLAWQIGLAIMKTADMGKLADLPQPDDVYIFDLRVVYFRQEVGASVAVRKSLYQSAGKGDTPYLYCVWQKSTATITQFKCARESYKRLDDAVSKALMFTSSLHLADLGEKPVNFPAKGRDMRSWGLLRILRRGSEK